MTTVRGGEPGAAAVEAPEAARVTAGPGRVIDLAADLTTGDGFVVLEPLEAVPVEPLVPVEVPRLPHRLSAVLVLLVLPLAVAVTVAAMTLMLPSAEADRAGAATGAMSRVQVAVLDGGDADLLERVTARLAEADVTVVPGGRAAGGPYERTEVIYHDPGARMTAAEVRRVLRVGKVILDPSFSGTAEVSVIVGKDFRYS